MSFPLKLSASRWMLTAGLLACAAAAQAASGFEVTPNQESRIEAGMSADAVRAALGTPERVIHYRNEPGPTWTYQALRGPGSDVTLFDVDFGADGKVASTSERLDESH